MTARRSPSPPASTQPPPSRTCASTTRCGPAAGPSRIDRSAIFGLDCDLFITAGIQYQIDEAAAQQLRAGILIEASNAPTTPEADAILRDRRAGGADLLCAAGGMVLAYFEWVQDMQSFFWTEEAITADLERIMDGASADVLAMSEAKSVDLRGAAMMVAVDRGRRHPARPLSMTDRRAMAAAPGALGGRAPQAGARAFPERRPRFITQSGVEIDRVYTSGPARIRPTTRIGRPRYAFSPPDVARRPAGTRSTTWRFPASRRSRAASIPPGIAAGCGRCACSPASAPPRTPTSASRP